MTDSLNKGLVLELFWLTFSQRRTKIFRQAFKMSSTECAIECILG